MLEFNLEELKDYVKKELNTTPNDRVVHCYSRANKDDKHIFVISDKEIIFNRPWKFGPQRIMQGDYIHANLSDVYAVRKDTFPLCFVETKN
jgi:hypothetical protein